MPYTENYANSPQIAFEGMVADTGLAIIVSRTVKTAALAFGFAVKLDTTEDHKVSPVTTGDTAIYGISVRDQNQDARAVDPDKYPIGETAPIMLKGTIWVKAGVAVAPGDPVYVTVADGTYKKASGAGNVQIANAIYETTAALNGLARIRLL